MFLSRTLPLLSCALLTASFGKTLGCHAQKPAPAAAAAYNSAAETITVGKPLPLADARRVEVLLRTKANLPPGASIRISPVAASEIPGYGQVGVSFSVEEQTSRPLSFLVSNDGKTVAQFNKYDVAADPRLALSPGGRPARGGPATAPVLVVGYDDLECPYCARLHASLFPLLTQRYGDKVHFVYKDYPLTEIHPWAMRAAVDVNCLAAQTGPGYWNAVDYIHAHAGEFGADPKDPKAEKTPARANDQLDAVARQQGKFQKVDAAKLDDCLKKQDTAVIKPMQQEGEGLSLASTPTLFINGDKIDGAVPPEFLFGVIDQALRAEGVLPPPPYVPPTPSTTPPAGQPGSQPGPNSGTQPGSTPAPTPAPAARPSVKPSAKP